MIDSNSYSFDTPSNELGTAFISINMSVINRETVTGSRAIGNLLLGWLICDNDKIFHKGGSVKSFKVMFESSVGGIFGQTADFTLIKTGKQTKDMTCHFLAFHTDFRLGTIENPTK
tara:strand:+ start:496 stop:843 length:348 start_codon:yes stop_codon:yes gene_type:complete